MNKLLKYILVAFGATSMCIASFTNAGLVLYTETQSDGQAIGTYTMQNKETINFQGAFYKCSYATNNSCSYWLDNNSYPMTTNVFYCFDESYAISCNSSTVIHFLNFPQAGILNQYTKNECKSTYGLIETNECTTMSSLECQTEYNLIPINDVNTNYCHVNFGMILPTECPTNEGSGAVSWTPRYINSVQYPGTSLLYINVPEDIAYSVTYNQEETIVDVEGYNADTEYIENVINNEKLTPTNEDFATMINGLIAFIPYLFIGLLFFRFARIIKKIWK